MSFFELLKKKAEKTQKTNKQTNKQTKKISRYYETNSRKISAHNGKWQNIVVSWRQWWLLLQNFIQLSLNSVSAKVQIQLTGCQRVHNSTKTIHFHHHQTRIPELLLSTEILKNICSAIFGKLSWKYCCIRTDISHSILRGIDT